MSRKIEEFKKYFDKVKYKIEDILDVIKILCDNIEKDDTCIDSFIYDLGLILKMRDFKNEEKSKIIDLLMKYNKNSTKDRASNIFLNEAEILQRKTILKSKPREIHVTITFKCNLKCIMCCNGYETEYELDDQLYDYLVDNMKYLERELYGKAEKFFYIRTFLICLIWQQSIMLNKQLLQMDYY